MVVAYLLTIAQVAMAFQVRVPAWATFHQPFNFSINDHSKYQITVFYFQIDKQEEIFNNFEIGNYFTFHLITVVVLLLSTYLLT